MDFDNVVAGLAKGRDIEELLAGEGWKGFEWFCSRIFEENGWSAKRNFRFKCGKRYEIDILAQKGDKMLAVDCKHWGMRSGKPSQLRMAADRQAERASAFHSQKTLDATGKAKECRPLLITLLQEDITNENGVWIVPVFRLNNFLLDIESFFG